MFDILIGMSSVAIIVLCSLFVVYFCTSEMHNFIKNKLLRYFVWFFVLIVLAIANVGVGNFAWQNINHAIIIDKE